MLVAMHTLAAQTVLQGLERNSALSRKDSEVVDSICHNFFTYTYQGRNWKFMDK
jgi:hypothetical protein